MDLPTGRVTFLFSDIEGSTRHAHRLGDDAWAGLLRRAYLGELMRLSSGVMSDEIAGLAMAAHLALRSDDPATGARLAGAAAAASEATGITNAALKILHVPDPADVARKRLGDAADSLIAEGSALPMEEALNIARSLIEEAVPAS